MLLFSIFTLPRFIQSMEPEALCFRVVRPSLCAPVQTFMYAKPTPERPVILLLDGHSSHKTLAAIDFCRSHNVTLISFPPHTTHRLQPLDICFFGPLKSFYNGACDNWMTMRPGQRIGFYDIAGLFSAATYTDANA